MDSSFADSHSFPDRVLCQSQQHLSLLDIFKLFVVRFFLIYGLNDKYIQSS